MFPLPWNYLCSLVLNISLCKVISVAYSFHNCSYYCIVYLLISISYWWHSLFYKTIPQSFLLASVYITPSLEYLPTSELLTSLFLCYTTEAGKYFFRLLYKIGTETQKNRDFLTTGGKVVTHQHVNPFIFQVSVFSENREIPQTLYEV